MWKTILAALCLCLAVTGCAPSVGQPARPVPAPEFAGIGNWFNSPPLTMAGLQGKVVLVEFWAFECINCIHVMPHVIDWHRKYRNAGLVVVGVHTPELEQEADTANVAAAVKRFGIEYPVAQDNDYRTWNAYGNRFWPAIYLIDRDGRIVYRHYGEGSYDVTEERIRALLESR